MNKPINKKNTDVDNDNEIEFEIEEGGDELNNKVKKLQKELKKCKQEKQEYLDGWQRSRADFANSKIQQEKNISRQRQIGKEDIIESILPVLDSFDIAFSNKEAWGNIDETWRKGIEFIYTQLINNLKDNNVTAIDTTNVVFDPVIHQSVETEETEIKEKDNTVAKILQKGYIIETKTIRPAREIGRASCRERV